MFKVDDKVAIYHGGNRYVGSINHIHSDGLLAVVTNGVEAYWNPKQCRRLKMKSSRRTIIWCHGISCIQKDPDSNIAEGRHKCADCVEYVEKRKK